MVFIIAKCTSCTNAHTDRRTHTNTEAHAHTHTYTNKPAGRLLFNVKGQTFELKKKALAFFYK